MKHWTQLLINKENEWFDSAGDSEEKKDILIGHQIEITRNIKGYKYPHQLNEKDLNSLYNRLYNIILSTRVLKNYAAISLSKREETALLTEKMILSDFEHDFPRNIIIQFDEKKNIIINQKDHLKIAVRDSSKRLTKIWNEALFIEKKIGNYLPFDYSEIWGYKTVDLSNVGTGLKIYTFLHIPGILLNGQIVALNNELNRRNYNMSGFIGDSKLILSGIIKISNKATIGLSEQDIIQETKEAVDYIINFEKEEREELLNHSKKELIDKMWRSYGILKTSRKLTISEMFGTVSALRFGIGEGFFNELNSIDINKLNKVLVRTQNSGLYFIQKGKISNIDLDEKRSFSVRKILAEKK